MFKALFTKSDDASTSTSGTFGALRAMLGGKYQDWRRDQDIDALMAPFWRLSDRHLSMIGIQDREEIYYFVAELMAQADERRQVADDVAKILEDSPVRGETSEDYAGRKSNGGVSVAA